MLRAKVFSKLYRLVRRFVIMIMAVCRQLRKEAPDLEDAVIVGDRIQAMIIRSSLRRVVYDFKIPDGIGVNIFDLYFPSPITFASFKDDLDTLEMWMRLGAGGGLYKTLMMDARSGNPRPRLQEVYRDGAWGLINAMGLPGDGVDVFLSKLNTYSFLNFNRPAGVSVGGSFRDDYIGVVERVEGGDCNKCNLYYELNISCPNTPEGQDISKDPKLLDGLLLDLRRATDRVVSVKVSPMQSDESLLAILEICKSHDRVFINAGNTQFVTCKDLGMGEGIFAMPGGGVSGPSLFARTLEMVRLLAGKRVPVMATGGISTIEQVDAVRDAGAVCVGMAHALVADPYVIPRINRQLL